MLDKELLRQIKNADEIIYISDNIQAELSGYSRTASGARGSTLNTQLHPSGSSIIEDSRRGGKDVAGGRAREMHSLLPASRDFHLKVKRLTMICASLALLQIMFAVHPRESVSRNFRLPCGPLQISFACHLASDGGITRVYCRAAYEESVSRCFILPPEQGKVRRSPDRGVASAASQSAGWLFCHMTLKVNPVTFLRPL